MKVRCDKCGEKKEANRTKESAFGFRKERNVYYKTCKACRYARERGIAEKKKIQVAKTQKELIAQDPYGHLAADVLSVAINDLKTNKKDYGIRYFFKSDIFELYCEVVGKDPEFVRENLGL